MFSAISLFSYVKYKTSENGKCVFRFFIFFCFVPEYIVENQILYVLYFFTFYLMMIQYELKHFIHVMY
jgi:hypothetical protein